MYIVKAARNHKLYFNEKYSDLDKTTAAYLCVCGFMPECTVIIYNEETGEVLGDNIK